jgi:translation initiation factor IF-2
VIQLDKLDKEEFTGDEKSQAKEEVEARRLHEVEEEEEEEEEKRMQLEHEKRIREMEEEEAAEVIIFAM